MKKNYWEYRVIMSSVGDAFIWDIREVYFEGGEPVMCSSTASYPMSSDSVDGLQEDMIRYANAITLPVLDYSFFEERESKETTNILKRSADAQ
jgi:hypothetical protein